MFELNTRGANNITYNIIHTREHDNSLNTLNSIFL